MKKVLLTILFTGLCAGAFAQNADREYRDSAPGKRTARFEEEARSLQGNPYVRKNAFAVGADLLYGSEIESVGIGFKFHWMISNSFRLAPNASIWFKNDGLSSWDINVDVQYLISLATRWRLYPQAGLTVSHWKRDANAAANIAKRTETNFGVNVGLGVEFDITRQWFVNLDFKYRIISDFDQAVLGLGFGYRF